MRVAAKPRDEAGIHMHSSFVLVSNFLPIEILMDARYSALRTSYTCIYVRINVNWYILHYLDLFFQLVHLNLLQVSGSLCQLLQCGSSSLTIVQDRS